MGGRKAWVKSRAKIAFYFESDRMSYFEAAHQSTVDLRVATARGSLGGFGMRCATVMVGAPAFSRTQLQLSHRNGMV